MLFDRTATVGVNVPGRRELRLRFPTDFEWIQVCAEIGFRNEDGALQDCLQNGLHWSALLDALVGAPQTFTEQETIWIIDRLVTFKATFTPVSTQRVRIIVQVFGGLTVAAEMWRPSAAAMGVYAETRDAPHPLIAGAYSLDMPARKRFFDQHVIAVDGYAAGKIPLFHACDFAAALVAFQHTRFMERQHA